MALSSSRIHRGRPTPFPWEREALDFIYQQIADKDPYQAWELHELYDRSSGRLYELDLVFLSKVGLFLVEIKSHPGILRGDAVDWTFAGGDRRRTIECPYPTANAKARILASMLARELGEPRPWVQAVIFVSKATQIALEGGTPPWLLTRDTVANKLASGLGDREPQVIVNTPMMHKIVQVAHKLGLRPSHAARKVGGYALGALVDDGDGYQEHQAQNAVVEKDRARIRTFLVPQATSLERRGQLERAARREAQALAELGQHPGILSYRTFIEDAPVGPSLVFEDFEGGLPLDAFLRQHPEVTFDERLNLIQQVVEAVGHCHRKNVLHRNLSPASVLVRRNDENKLQIKLHRFLTAASIDHSSFGTKHLGDFSREVDRLYQAPEVLADPTKAIGASDVFSVGCLAWLVFTGQHPGTDLQDRDSRLKPLSKEDDGGLRPSSVRNELAPLDEAVAFATRPNPYARADDVTVWFEGYLIDELTRPAPAEAERDPIEAQKGDTLAGYSVEKRLGSGGTALVLKLRRNGKDFALKVPHDEGCAERLLAEAKVLKGVRHEHIVELLEVLTVGKRPCLLLEFAGDRTLGDQLRAEGALALDLARRYGDDLLSAVQKLEENDLTHRDIKPSNIGFTSQSKKQQHLLLFDFSLAAANPTAITAGTAEWRDPWLHARGRWDAAADRWSSAAVLYHLLTGVKPLPGEGASNDEVRIEAERLDPAVRDRLAAFFRKAFARKPEDRFSSAEAMRSAWAHALVAEESEDAPRPEALDLSQVRQDTLVEALPLSSRARNGLDRAGVRTVRELLQLPRNHVSVIRGVGRKVAQEIVKLADRLREALTVDPVPLFLPGFVRPRLSLGDPELALPEEPRRALEGAGISTTVELAQAEAPRVLRLVGEAQAAAIKSRLEGLAAAEPAPGSLEDWVRALIGRASETEASKRFRVLAGLEPLPGAGKSTALPATRSIPETAVGLELEPGQLHSSLQWLRNKRWIDNPVTPSLVETLSGLLDAAGPVVSFEELAQALAVERAGPEPTVLDVQNAQALVRVALELRPKPFAFWRRLGAQSWIAREEAALDGLAALRSAADCLAATEPLPSTEAVRAALADAVEDTPLMELPADRRVILAAKASETAAASARLELYPRQMDAARALTLFGPLIGELTAQAIRQKVALRYPDAQPLPERPELDVLLASQGLTFNTDLGCYRRPGQVTTTSMTVQAPSRPSTTPSFPVRQSPDAQRAAVFQGQLDSSLKAGRFRVLQVRADRAALAIPPLLQKTGAELVSFDDKLFEAVRAEASALEVAWETVEATDRDGPLGPDWALLLQLMERAAMGLVESLMKGRSQPLLLVWPGALARYGLARPLERLVELSEHGEGASVLLLVPSHLDGLAPSINGRLPVPAPLPQQRLVIPEEWLARVVPAENA